MERDFVMTASVDWKNTWDRSDYLPALGFRKRDCLHLLGSKGKTKQG